MQLINRRIAALVSYLACTILAPGPALAGDYGSAGIADSLVTPFASRQHVWCQKLELFVPANLHAQMDCSRSPNGMAYSAVLDSGISIENSPRQRLRRAQGGEDETRRKDAEQNQSATSAASVDKWERLNELGVTRENYRDQSDGFRKEVSDFVANKEPGSDWSGFRND